jgi:Tol biopolymer transport system component
MRLDDGDARAVVRVVRTKHFAAISALSRPFAPVWSPDGQWIAVIADPQGIDLYGIVMVVPVSGVASGVRALTDDQLAPVKTSVRPLYCMSWR